MTVKEILTKLPLAETYELSADKRYLIVVDPASVSRDAVERMLWKLEKRGIRAVAISTFRSDSLEIFDMEGE